jgi:hypothetical protein
MKIFVQIGSTIYAVRRLKSEFPGQVAFSLSAGGGKSQIVSFCDAGSECTCGHGSAFSECLHARDLRNAYRDLAVPIHPSKRFFSLTNDAWWAARDRRQAVAVPHRNGKQLITS